MPNQFQTIAEKYLKESDYRSHLPKDYFLEIINEKHSSLIIKWRNDPSNRSNFLSQTILSLESQKKFLDTYAERDRVDFVLSSINDGPVGVFNLTDLSTDSPQIGQLMGNIEHRGRGLSKKVSSILLIFGFQWLHLKKIQAVILHSNNININLHKSLGFQFLEKALFDQREFDIFSISNEPRSEH